MYDANAKMYNAVQKEAFISIQKSDDAKYTASYLFKALSTIEDELGYDIANGDPHQYGYMMWKVIDFGSLEYFKKLYNLLLRYRTFCFSKKYVDRTIFASNRGDEIKATSSPAITQMYLELSSKNLDDIMDIYLKPESMARKLMNYFCNRNYFSYVDSKFYTMEDMLVLYIMLTYYGMKDEELATITTDNISADRSKIHSNDRTFDIDDGLTLSMIEKRLSSDAIFSKTHNQGYKAEMLSETHLMLADDGRDGLTQIKNYYTLYRKNKMMAANVDVELPTLKEVKLYGNIYRTCCMIIRADIDATDKNEVLRVYCKTAGVTKLTNAKGIEVYDKILNTLDAMKNK